MSVCGSGSRGAAARACPTSSSSTTRSVPTTRSSTSTGLQVVCDKKSYLYLNGITLDYVTQGLQGGFTFLNPARNRAVGAGHRSRPEARPGRHERGPGRARCCFEERLVSDYFTVFGLPRKLGVDGEALQRRFYELSRAAPSRFPPGGGRRAPGGSPGSVGAGQSRLPCPARAPRARGVPDRAGRGSRGPGGRDRQAEGAPGAPGRDDGSTGGARGGQGGRARRRTPARGSARSVAASRSATRPRPPRWSAAPRSGTGWWTRAAIVARCSSGSSSGSRPGLPAHRDRRPE